MSTVTVTIPKMLAELVASPRTFPLEAATVGDTLAALITKHPQLRVHLFDESGGVRRHVLCFHNDAARLDLAASVADGDTVTILQAVSGGQVRGVLTK